MTPRSLRDMLLLAALWGASFLFMRISVPEFGAAPMALMRDDGGAAFVLPILLWRGQWPALRERWLAIGFVGITNSAIPFLCYGFAALTISAGLASVLTDDTIGSVTYCYDPKNPHQSRALAATPGGLLQPSSSAFALLSHRQFRSSAGRRLPSTSSNLVCL